MSENGTPAEERDVPAEMEIVAPQIIIGFNRAGELVYNSSLNAALGVVVLQQIMNGMVAQIRVRPSEKKLIHTPPPGLRLHGGSH